MSGNFPKGNIFGLNGNIRLHFTVVPPLGNGLGRVNADVRFQADLTTTALKKINARVQSATRGQLTAVQALITKINAQLNVMQKNSSNICLSLLGTRKINSEVKALCDLASPAVHAKAVRFVHKAQAKLQKVRSTLQELAVNAVPGTGTSAVTSVFALKGLNLSGKIDNDNGRKAPALQIHAEYLGRVRNEEKAESWTNMSGAINLHVAAATKETSVGDAIVKEVMR